LYCWLVLKSWQINLTLKLANMENFMLVKSPVMYETATQVAHNYQYMHSSNFNFSTLQIKFCRIEKHFK
jgi:hypothetical protein